MTEKTRKQRLKKNKNKAISNTQKNSKVFFEKVKTFSIYSKEKLILLSKKMLIIGKKIQKESVAKSSEVQKSVSVLMKEQEMKREINKTEKIKKMEEQKQELRKENDILCKPGALIHQQGLEYGKGNVEFYFGGYLNENTISIVVDNILGTRAYSSTYHFQIEEGTVFDLPGLYNDGTSKFKNVFLKVLKKDSVNNIVHFEKN